MALIKIKNCYQDYCNESSISNVSNYIIKGAVESRSNNATVGNIANEILAVQRFFKYGYGDKVIHLIISFDPNDIREMWSIEDLCRIADAVSDILSDYQLLYSIHFEKNRHVHFMFNPVAFRNGQSIFDNPNWPFEIVSACKKVLKASGIDGRSIRVEIGER